MEPNVLFTVSGDECIEIIYNVGAKTEKNLITDAVVKMCENGDIEVSRCNAGNDGYMRKWIYRSSWIVRIGVKRLEKNVLDFGG